MNVTYYTDFVGVCPVDGARDDYSLTISSTTVVQVEEILAAIARATKVPSYQEEITQKIAEELPGAEFIRVVGTHSGVKTVVVA